MVFLVAIQWLQMNENTKHWCSKHWSDCCILLRSQESHLVPDLWIGAGKAKTFIDIYSLARKNY